MLIYLSVSCYNRNDFLYCELSRLMALSHYNVLANLFRRMKNFPNTLVYAEVAKKNQVKVSFQTYV